MWREPWGAGARVSGGRGEHEPGLALADALALEEALAGLESVAEVAHGAVERRGARVHAQDGEDAAVGLDEGDVEGGGHVLHVELGDDLAAEVEQDQVALDLLRGGALKAGRVLLAGWRRPGRAARCSCRPPPS